MTTQAITTTKWSLDPTHSEIGFKVKHMMITNVSGTFEKFDASVLTEESDFTTSVIEFFADIDSISTGNSDRDAHLKSADFFDVANFPRLRFVASRFEKKDDTHYLLHGDLTIRGTTRPVRFDVEFGGLGKDPWGNEKAGFTVSGKINRTDFKLNWNAALETGGVLVGEEVKLSAEIQLIKQKG